MREGFSLCTVMRRKQSLDSFSFTPFFHISSPWCCGPGREGRTPLLGHKESNLKVEGVELINSGNGRIDEENKES